MPSFLKIVPGKIISLLYFLFFSVVVFSQGKDTLTYGTMSREQFGDISVITDNWLKNDFQLCLKKEKIKMSCAHCSSVYLKVIACIDSTGRLSSYTKIKTNVCGREMKTEMENCMMNYFKSLIFPVSLRNTKIELFLGNGLKC